MVRPSHKELNGKINNAINCIVDKNINFENPVQFVKDAHELNLSLTSEEILKVMNEVKPEHYIGKRPPEQSYESKIKNCELFTFKWLSQHLQQVIYLKFAFNGDQFWFSSLHKDRPLRG